MSPGNHPEPLLGPEDTLIVLMIIENKPRSAIARKVGVCERQLHRRTSDIRKKLGAKNDCQLAISALSQGVIKASELTFLTTLRGQKASLDETPPRQDPQRNDCYGQ